jgi:hypothetical protein
LCGALQQNLTHEHIFTLSMMLALLCIGH